MTSRSRKVVFAEQFYFPDGWGGAQIPRDITTHLANSGSTVSVVCGSDQYAPVQDDCGPDPTTCGVRIVRLPRLFGGDIHSFKLLRQLWFYFLATPALLLRGRPDLYVAQTNPPMLVPIVAMVSRLRDTPFMIIAQDLYPEVVIAHGMLRDESLAARLLRKLFTWAYSRARVVVALGPVMAERLQNKGVARDRVVVISNWATGEESVVRGEDNLLRARWNLEGKFVILYSGNLGIAHEFETIILALERAIKSRPEIRLVIVGKGSRLEEVRALVHQRNLGEFVVFQDMVPANMLPHSIGLADLALVTLRSAFEGLVVPSKLLGYMARGIPTLYVGPKSDVTAMLNDSAGGLSFPPAAVEQLADGLVKLASNRAILRSMGDTARAYYDSQLSRDIALEKYVEVVNHHVRMSNGQVYGEARS